jgi:cell division transport system permease protein
MRIGFFLKEAFRALSRNAAPSLAALITIVLTALVLGVFIPVVQATTSGANNVRAKVIADVYLAPDATDRDVARVQRIIADETPGVARVQFIPKEQAYAQERKRDPELYELLGGTNPLPDTFRITPIKPDDITKVRDSLAPLSPSGARTVVDPAIDEVRNKEDDTEKILSATRVVKLTMGLLAGLLALASLLLVANTIRLSLYARRREIEVMKLVGATNWFIRWPFVLEGLIVGLCGAGLAVGILWAGKLAIIDPLAQNFNLIDNFSTIGFVPLIATLMAAAVVVSALGSGVTLRRFLRV